MQINDLNLHSTGHEWQDEYSRITAMTDPAFGPSGRPMLVLACISQASIKRMPCFYLAHELRLNLRKHPWMVSSCLPWRYKPHFILHSVFWFYPFRRIILLDEMAFCKSGLFIVAVVVVVVVLALALVLRETLSQHRERPLAGLLRKCMRAVPELGPGLKLWGHLGAQSRFPSRVKKARLTWVSTAAARGVHQQGAGVGNWTWSCQHRARAS